MSQKLHKIKQFHHIHGSDIVLHHHWHEARRTQTTTNGLVFTSKPIQINQKIAIKLLHVSDELPAIISIGFTSHDPNSLDRDFPTNTRSELKRKSGFWMCSLSKQVCTKNRVIFFYVNSSGNIKYGMNGDEKGTFDKKVDTRGQLWGLIDIWSPQTVIQLCGYKMKSTMFHHFSSRNVKISENCLYKSYKKRRTSYAFTLHPLGINEMIKVKCLDDGSFVLGLIACDPASLKHRHLPENVETLLDRPEYWTVINDPSWYFTHNEEISYLITQDGEIRIWKNNSLLSKVIRVDHTEPLWGFFALCSIRSVQVTSHLTNEMSAAIPSAPALWQTEMPSSSCNTGPPHSSASSGHGSAKLPPTVRNLKDEDDSLCVVCCDNVPEAALIPCGHMCMCLGCTQKQWRGGGDGHCPICRSKIQNVLKVYKL